MNTGTTNATPGSRRTLVVGSSGQLGTALVHALGEAALPAARNPAASGALQLDLATLAGEPALAHAVLREYKADAVLCAAGATDVERCETDPAWAQAANHTGPLALAKAAAAADIPFVFFSTDYVFDGTQSANQPGGPYSETDPAHPLSIYGSTKLDGERAILQAHPRALVVRTTTVYGPDPQGKNFLYTLRRLLTAGQTMRVPTDQLATPTQVEDLATASLALLRGGHTGVFHVAGPEFLSRFDFAILACGLLGLATATLQPVTTPELRQRAARPLLGGLRIDHLTSVLGHNPMRTPEQGIRDWAASEAARAAAHAT